MRSSPSAPSPKRALRGANTIRFSGRLGGTKLAGGTYTLLATPAGGRSAKTTFKIKH